SEEYDVGFAGVFEIVNHLRPDDKVFTRAGHPNTMLLHRVKMRTTRKQHHIFTAARHARADVSAYRSGSRYQESQRVSTSEPSPAASTSSPQVGCGTPKHAASATAGCWRSTRVISLGAIFSPPRLISSLSRANKRR